MNKEQKLNTVDNQKLNISIVSGSFSLSTIQSFLEFENTQKKIMRGNIEMYDIIVHYKYLTFTELFNWYVSRI